MTKSFDRTSTGLRVLNDQGRTLSVLNMTTINYIRASLGDEAATNLVRLFAKEVQQHFLQFGSTEIDRGAMATKAHNFGGSAGLLGFERLARACSNLSAGVYDQAFDDFLLYCRFECEQALDEITFCLGKEPFADVAVAGSGKAI